MHKASAHQILRYHARIKYYAITHAQSIYGHKTLLDVRVFNPYAPSNRNTSISNCYRKHEAEKRRTFEQRIRTREVEHSTFTPLVFSATGGMAKQSTTFYKRLASLLADRWEQPYSSTLGWLRCRLSS